jgi:hypothetical protein
MKQKVLGIALFIIGACNRTELTLAQGAGNGS